MTITINNQIWTILNVRPTSSDLLRSDGTITLGVCDDTVKTIFIANNLSREMYDKVLCHELTHAFAFEYDYYMPIDTEEIVADFMSLYGREIINIADEIMNLLTRRVA